MSISTRSVIAVVLGAFFLLAWVVPEARAGTSPDAWITTKTKIAMVTTSHINSNAVHVDTVDGRVTLHGKVGSELQKENAGSVARSIEGVKSVRNLLQVVAASHEKAVDEADEQIKDRIGKVLKEELVDSRIKLKSVNQGAVLLAGEARNLSEYLHALEAINSVPGVRSIASEVISANQTLEPDPSVGKGVKNAARDSWITTATKLRLLADGDVPALDISVDTYRGNVTLFGIVPTDASKAAAEADARKVDSVVSITNELQVVPTTNKEWVNTKDDIIRRDIKTALKTRPELKHVDVDVKSGSVRLSGTVASDWQSLRAATIARGTKGVRSVDDDLRREPIKAKAPPYRP
jgi:hyperosmotically inducible protein